MSKPRSPEDPIATLLEMVHALREDSLHQTQLLQQIMASLPQEQDVKDKIAVESLSAWQPVVDDREVTESFLAPNNLQKIKEHSVGSQDIVARLKKMGLGQFYIKHIKPIPPAKKIVIFTWRMLYKSYANYLITHSTTKNIRRWRTLIKLNDYVKEKGISTIILLEAVHIKTPAPKVSPAEGQSYLLSPHDDYTFPPVYVATVSDSLVYGGTNLIFTEDSVICHDLYDFERDFTSEELHGRHFIDPEKMRMRLLCDDIAPEQVPIAAIFTDACASNYSHWLTEVLPRIAAFCSDKQFENIPIIVNDGLHHNIMASLILITGLEREIIALPVGRAIQVESLYITSVAGYVPFERRNNKLIDHSHGLFSSSAFDLIRERILTYVDQLPLQDWPEKIYLRRNAVIRKVINSVELEQLLVDQGYSIVEPEKLTFLEQVMLFSKAKKIIGSSGAALANIVFASPNTHIQIIIGKYPNTSYWYWQNMACASKNNVSYTLCDINNKLDSIHSSFEINTDFLRD